jgi:hypothetical protein
VPLLRASVAELRALALEGTLSTRLATRYRFSMGYRATAAQLRAWEHSLRVLSADLVEAGLDSVEVLVEYQLPLTSKRADVVLAGVHPRTGRPAFVVVELKQWSTAETLSDAPDVCRVQGHPGRDLEHPVAQVRGYARHMRDFLASLEAARGHLLGIADLHNATDASVADLFELPADELGRLVTGQRRGELLELLRSTLGPLPGLAAADLLLGSAVRPSRQLLSVAADEVQQREQFVLLDEQQVAYSLVMRAVERARRGDAKEVVVVTGGPGSGKSVIALSLLGELARQSRSVLHATGSSAFTGTLRRVAGRRAPAVKSLFKYFNQFVDADPNGIEVLVCDEAHRIRASSANRYTPAAHRTGRPQVDELIAAARVPVFLLDEHQVVRPGEIGTVADIRAAAARLGLDVRQVDLDGQFRCGGSRAYEEWVLRLLGLVGEGPVPWGGDDHMRLDVAESPEALETALRSRLAEGYTARITAGYCWPWSDPQPDGRLVADVVVGQWRRPWNNKKETAHGGAPARSFWASDPAGFDQVGCVYTAQGFEYDWNGVILGPDLVWRTDRWVADRSASHDSAMRRSSPEDFDRAVRNTYKVLLTRAMEGTLVMSTDAETQDLLRRLIQPAERSGTEHVDQHAATPRHP